MCVDKEDILLAAQTVLGKIREEIENRSEVQLIYERVRRGEILRIPGQKSHGKELF